MIKFINIINSEPYNLFEKFYKKALDHNEKFIEAISVSSAGQNIKSEDSRYVNLKYINKDEWVFFSIIIHLISSISLTRSGSNNYFMEINLYAN